jgi:hypothetical protein
VAAPFGASCSLGASRRRRGERDRTETRTATVITDMYWLQEGHRWPRLRHAAIVHCVRETENKTEVETTKYLLITELMPERLNELARAGALRTGCARLREAVPDGGKDGIGGIAGLLAAVGAELPDLYVRELKRALPTRRSPSNASSTRLKKRGGRKPKS